MQTIESVQEVVTLIKEELSAVKTIVETNLSEINSTKIAPLIVFFTSPETRYIVASSSASGDFADVVCRISEVMNIYPLIDAHAAVISMNTNVEIDDDVVSAINTFVISYEQAWSITTPYEVYGNEVVWWNDKVNIELIDDLQLDDESRQMVSMFYMYVHVNDVHFTMSELLSYLSTMDTAINFIEDDAPPFFDMSNNELIQNINNVN